MPNAFSVDVFLYLVPRVVASSNPGLELANAFGVNPGLELANPFGVLVKLNASKTRMIFFQRQWEQKLWLGCLRGSLSGKGQKLLTAPIPAPGGDQ